MVQVMEMEDMTVYKLHDGTVVSREQIIAAFERGRAVLVHYRIDWGIGVGLMLDGTHYDLRGRCDLLGDEQWTSYPTTAYEAIEAARSDV